VTYFQFLGLFLIVPIVALLWLTRKQLRRGHWLTMGAIALIALVYTTPWDNALILNGVWSYTRAQIQGIVLGVAPLEEYAFFILQVVLCSLFTVWLLRRFGDS
jgi:lycopene cyclase domain-containing protein